VTRSIASLVVLGAVAVMLSSAEARSNASAAKILAPVANVGSCVERLGVQNEISELFEYSTEQRRVFFLFSGDQDNLLSARNGLVLRFADAGIALFPVTDKVFAMTFEISVRINSKNDFTNIANSMCETSKAYEIALNGHQVIDENDIKAGGFNPIVGEHNAQTH
jgi:hypothetical protein